MRKNRKQLKPRVKLVLVLVAVVAVVVVTLCVVIGISEYDYRFVQAVNQDGAFKVYPSTSLATAAEQLQEKGYIASADQMLKFARRHDKDTALVGNYDLTEGMSYRTLLTRLNAGQQSPVRMTFHNIRTTERLAAVASRYTLTDSSAFMRYFSNDSVLNAEGFDSENFIGMFIPNTYEVYWTITPEEFVAKMREEYDDFWGSSRRGKAEDLGFTPQEITVIASIVTQETNAVAEMSDVAGVYINRLRKGIPLQADPTIKFAMRNFGLRRILNKHLTTDSPYNTYKYKGLPPGPICMPTIAALDAVLDYQGHDYYYFCANADFSGTHAFARNLAEHNRNAKAYQRELNRRKIK